MRASLASATLARERAGVRASRSRERSLVCCAACAAGPPRSLLLPPPAPTPAPPPHDRRRAGAAGPRATCALPAETHLANLRQLTFGGENAEAYWSWAGDALIVAGARRPRRRAIGSSGCRSRADGRAGVGDAARVERARRDDLLVLPARRSRGDLRVDRGGRRRLPARPDHSQGYVWALYPDYDIYRANADGSGARRLTTTPGYDAEGTVCGKDGSIVFTSVRDGDIDVYRMDADGKNVRRLTHDVGYDGGAVFDADCTHIVWRASRPKPGKELDDYKRLLAQNLVRPSKLELYVMDADGSQRAPGDVPGRGVVRSRVHARRAAPHLRVELRRSARARVRPVGDRRRGHAPGTDHRRARLRRLPAVLARRQAAGVRVEPRDRARRARHQRVRRRLEARRRSRRPRPAEPNAPADRILADIRWLADPAREGRGIGTHRAGGGGRVHRGALQAARPRARRRRRRLPAGVPGAHRPEGRGRDGAAHRRRGRAARRVPAARVLGARARRRARWCSRATGWSTRSSASTTTPGSTCAARSSSCAASCPSTRRCRRPSASGAPATCARRRGSRASTARARCWSSTCRRRPKDAPADWKPPAEPALSPPRPSGYGDAGIPVLMVKRAVLAPVDREAGEEAARRPPSWRSRSATRPSRRSTWSAALREPGAPASTARRAWSSSARTTITSASASTTRWRPTATLPHLGADDNASGTATVLEIARQLAAKPEPLARDVVFVAFSGEEEGTLGSTHFTRAPPAGLKVADVRAMINLDMVGRLRDNRATILGAASAAEWPALLAAACADARIDCAPSPDGGFGPSDQMPFYAAGVPVVHFFTGSHSDYHKPSDAADRINAAGAAQIGAAVASLATRVAARNEAFTFQRMTARPPRATRAASTRRWGRSRTTRVRPAARPACCSRACAAAPRREGRPARGDILIKLGTHPIGGVEDLMYALNASKPGETVTAVVKRDGKELKLPVTFEEGRREEVESATRPGETAETRKPQPFSGGAGARAEHGPGRRGDAPAGRCWSSPAPARARRASSPTGWRAWSRRRRPAPHPGGHLHQQGRGRAARARRQAALGADGDRHARAVGRDVPRDGARILRQWGEAVGLRKDFVIYDDDDQKRLLARVLIDLKVPERMFPVRQVLSAIDRAKNQGMSGADFVSNDYFDDVVGKAYRLYEERLAAANATDFGGLLLSVLKLVASGTPARRGDRAALRSRAGRRVPGHQQRAVPAGAPAVAPHEQHHRRRRRGPVDLPLARRRHPQHPRLRERPPGRAGRQAGAKLPLHRQHPGRRQRDHREEHRAAAEAPVHRGGGGRPDRPVRGRDRARRGRVRRQPHRRRRCRRRWRRATSRSSTGPTRSRACWKTRCARAICPTRSSAARASSIAPRSRTWSRTCARSPTPTTASRCSGSSTSRRAASARRPSTASARSSTSGRSRPGRRWSWWREDEQLLGSGPRKKVAAFVALMARLRGEGAALGPASLAEKILEESGYRDALAGEATMEAEGRIENLLELVAQMREYEREAEEPTLHGFLERIALVSDVDGYDAGQGRDLADDGAHGEGAGVPGRVHHRPRGADLPARAQRRRRFGRRGGAAPLLRRGHARAQAAATCRACGGGGCRGRSCPACRAASCAICPRAASRRS